MDDRPDNDAPQPEDIEPEDIEADGDLDQPADEPTQAEGPAHEPGCDDHDPTLDPHATMSFGDHLDELRRRVIRMALAVILCFFVTLYFKDAIVSAVIEPARQALRATGAEDSLVYPDPVAGISGIFKILLIVSVFISSPVVLYQIWAFVAAGLYPRERRLVYILGPLSLGLFVGGILFCYLWLLPTALPFLIDFVGKVAQPQFFLKETALFIIHFSLIMGVVFEIPLIVFFLARSGIVGIDTLKKYRRHFYVVAFVIGAFLTPPDPVTQIGMAIPIVIFYEGGILLARFLRNRALDDER